VLRDRGGEGLEVVGKHSKGAEGRDGGAQRSGAEASRPRLEAQRSQKALSLFLSTTLGRKALPWGGGRGVLCIFPGLVASLDSTTRCQ
jgi:hypothetical protein